jgi:competence protein ComEC
VRRLVFASLGMVGTLLGHLNALWPMVLVMLLTLSGVWRAAGRMVPLIWFWAGVMAGLLALHNAPPPAGNEALSHGWGGIFEVTRTSVTGGPQTVWRARLSGLAGVSQCQLTAPGSRPLGAGDLWLGRALVGPPEGGMNPHSFDYRSYLRRRGVHWVARFDRVILVRPGRGPRAWLAAVKLSWQRRVTGALRATGMRCVHRAILMALLTGNQREIQRPTRDLLSTAGMAHLVAISGLHLGCFVLFVEWLLGGVCFLLVGRRCHRMVIGGGLTAATWFLIVSGSPMSALRAYIMVCGYGAARWWGEDYDLWSWLGVASLLVLAAQPGAITEPGFQLSTLAVASIAAVFQGEAVEARPRSALVAWAGQMLRASAGAFAGTLGATWWHFGVVAWGGILLNVLAIPIVSLWILPLALLATVIPPDAWLPRGLLLNVCAHAIEVLEGLALHGASWSGAGPGPWPGWLKVTTISALLLLVSRRGPRMIRGLALAACVALLWMPRAPSGGDVFSVRVLAVGEGDATLIGLPCGKWWLVDGGPRGAGKEVLAPLLRREGVGRLDRVFVTHGHADHYGGLLELPPHLAICDVWTNGTPAGLAAGERIRRRHPGCGLELPGLVAAGSGRATQECGVDLEVMWPEALQPGETENDRSLVIRLGYRGQSILLTGDLEGKHLAAILLERLARGPWLMVKVPHHGRPAPYLRALVAAGDAGHFVVSRGGRSHGGEGSWCYGSTVRQGFWWATGNRGAFHLFHDGRTWRAHVFR